MPRERRREPLSRRQFNKLWLELTCRQFRKGGRVPVALPLALSTRIVENLPNGGTAEAWVRAEQIGSGCDKRWEIAGFYSGPFPCIGQAAVLDALNDVAADVCRTHMKDCPNRCPPVYTPRTKLGTYDCIKPIESAGLLQGDRVWNCECTEQPT